VNFSRYGVYFTPEDPAFAAAGASWLGWDIRTGQKVGTPDPALVARPCRYGFHATIKPPFRLADQRRSSDLESALQALSRHLSPVTVPGLQLSWPGSFLAFTALGDAAPLNRLAAAVVRDLDRYRAPASEADLARHRKPHMSDAELRNLARWGYPYVMDRFRFHMTLTGPLPRAAREDAAAMAAEHFNSVLPKPMVIGSLTLVGEAEDGFFHELARHPLSRSR
jgi:hypothetical protein